MISELVEGITKQLKADGLEIREVGFKDLVDGTINLTRPAVNVVVKTGDYQKVTLTSYKCRADVSVYIVFQDVRGGTAGDTRRREGVYKILEAVTQSLLLSDCGLDFLENPLFPVSFRNVTTAEYAKVGFQIYELMFWCSFIFEKTDRDDLGYLNSLLVQYYLQPRDYTGMIGVTGPEASDLINCPTGVVA